MIINALKARRCFSELAALDEDAFPLDRAALVMALDEYPELDLQEYLRRLDTLAAHVEVLAGEDRAPVSVIESINEILFVQEGLRGNNDDYYDPRKGFRLDVGRWWSPPARSSDPDYYRIEYNATAYLPLGKHSTWLFNYFRSDAHVDRKGETNPLVIEKEQGLNCSDPALTAQEKADCDSIISNIIAGNTYGTATGLGGTSHLRSYPSDRYSGAHTVFYGTEIRWTLTEEAHPFDIFIAKDVRTVLQVAVFYEMGSVADRREDLGDVFRASYGTGFRMVTASGIVLRADVATGREGIETTIIIGYPWESF